MIITRLRLSHFQKILFTESAVRRSSNWGNFGQFFWGRQVKKCIFGQQILIMFLFILFI